MGAPQIIVIVLWAIALGICVAKDGQPKTALDGSAEKYSFVLQLVRTAIWAPLLWWGGFFS